MRRQSRRAWPHGRSRAPPPCPANARPPVPGLFEARDRGAVVYARSTTTSRSRDPSMSQSPKLSLAPRDVGTVVRARRPRRGRAEPRTAPRPSRRRTSVAPPVLAPEDTADDAGHRHRRVDGALSERTRRCRGRGATRGLRSLADTRYAASPSGTRTTSHGGARAVFTGRSVGQQPRRATARRSPSPRLVVVRARVGPSRSAGPAAASRRGITSSTGALRRSTRRWPSKPAASGVASSSKRAGRDLRVDLGGGARPASTARNPRASPRRRRPRPRRPVVAHHDVEDGVVVQVGELDGLGPREYREGRRRAATRGPPARTTRSRPVRRRRVGVADGRGGAQGRPSPVTSPTAGRAAVGPVERVSAPQRPVAEVGQNRVTPPRPPPRPLV